MGRVGEMNTTKMKVFIFGTGEFYNKYCKWVEQFDIIAFLDNNIKIQGTFLNGHKILSPKELKNYTYDRIYILSSYLNEIKKQLISMGVSEQKIFYFFQLEASENNTNISCYCAKEAAHENSLLNKKIILISHDLSITGAPNCLLQVAKILRKNYYDVTLVSPYDGELREDFLAIGITVIVDERLRMGTIKDINWMRKYDIIFVEIPVIWWIHEPEILYKCVISDLICKIKKQNLRLYTISDVAKQALNKFWPDVCSNNFLYGIPDQINLTKDRSLLRKLLFITVGSISKLKGHDVLLQAISLLKKDQLECAEFWFVGKTDTEFGQKVIHEISDKKLPVRVWNEIKNQAVLDLLDISDVLICASRMETMSMAVTEGMMKEVPVIVSSAAGISRYIKDGKNGLIFQSENAAELSKKISYCIENRQELRKMAQSGRRTYLEKFSFRSLEKRLIMVMEQL